MLNFINTSSPIRHSFPLNKHENHGIRIRKDHSIAGVNNIWFSRVQDLGPMCSDKMLVIGLFISTLLWCIIDAACPGIVTKKEWDGLRPLHVKYLPRPVELVIIQHTVTPTCSTFESCKSVVQSIQNTHMEDLKYWDIGMSFLVGGDGKVYEGSGWLHVGAHTYRYNNRSIAISFIGNFNNDEPTSEALAAAKELIKCGVEEGHVSPNYYLVGHKQLVATESPGRKLYREIRTWPHYLEDATPIKNPRTK